MALRKDLAIMVVDDEPVALKAVVLMLDHLGMANVRSAENALDALRELNKAPADIVISDFQMPGTTGLDLLKHLRGKPATSNVHFIMISGADNYEWIDEALQFQLDRFIPKPLELNRLRSCLESITGPAD